MKAIKIFYALCFLFAMCSCACAAEYAQGEALVTLRTPENLEQPEIFAENVAASVNAKVVTVYGALSAANAGRVFALFRSENSTTKELISTLKENPDVLSASPNYKVRANTGIKKIGGFKN